MKTIRRLLEWFGLLRRAAVPVRPVRRKTRARRRAKPAAVAPVAELKPPRAKPKPAVNHAAVVKIDLLNAVADALGRAPVELDPLQPKATIAINGSLFIIPNTVAALSEFQSRLEGLKTTVKAPLVPRNAVASSHNVMAKQRSYEESEIERLKQRS